MWELAYVNNIYKVILATIVEGDLKASFPLATTLKCWGEYYSFKYIYIYIYYIYIYIYIYISGAMGKLTSNFCKNENNTDISLYQIYLLKLH